MHFKVQQSQFIIDLVGVQTTIIQFCKEKLLQFWNKPSCSMTKNFFWHKEKISCNNNHLKSTISCSTTTWWNVTNNETKLPVEDM